MIRRDRVRARRTRALAGGALATGVLAAGVLAAGVLAAGVATAPVAGGATGVRSALSGAVPSLPRGAIVDGPVAAQRQIEVSVVLAVPDPGQVSAFVAAVSDPSSPDYRHYLAPGQFAARFGPSPAAIAAVRAYLAGQGLAVGPTAGDGLEVPASGPASAVEGAFATGLAQVTLPSGVRGFTATATPSVPASLGGAVQSVMGLNDLSTWRPQLAPMAAAPGGAARASAAVGVTAATSGAVAAAAGGGPQPCAAEQQAQAPTSTLSMAQLASTYGFSGLYAQGRTGLGVTIALYELEPYDPSDVAAFESCYGLDNPIRQVAVDGGAGTGPGVGEAALDIEDAAAMAPGATLEVYEGPNSQNDGPGAGPYDVWSRIASDDNAQVVSTSWGQCESMDYPPQGGGAGPGSAAAAENAVFQVMAAQGQTVVAATGDDGSEACYSPQTSTPQNPGTQLAVDDPASQPYVTAVGGTALPNGATTAGETVWNDCAGAGTSCAASGSAGAGGGGISSNWPMPSWQTAAGARGTINPYSSGLPCGASSGYCREVPDVAADASPATGYQIYFQGHWSPVGGTSAATPLWAALFAVTDQGCSAGVGFVDPALYALGGSAAFHDVTTGENDLTGNNFGKYPAGPGYDLASGWGSPNGGTLAAGLQPAGGCPAVAALSSTFGPAAGGAVLTITGSDLAPTTAVDFGPGRAARVLSQSPTSLTVVVPAGSPGVVPVTVTTPNGTSAAAPQSEYVYGRSGAGYWEVAADGGIFAFGDANFYGSMGGRPLDRPVVGMAATPDDGGYWEVASDGGIFAFGDANFYGSMGGRPLDRPVVGMAATPDGGGYWEVASDGGIFAFGDAAFYGSMGGRPLNQPIVGIAATPDG
ncbi:MAG: protease pro-enzyme activation domain-containing protein, partial [Acidimicrobiales bacterium]